MKTFVLLKMRPASPAYWWQLLGGKYMDYDGRSFMYNDPLLKEMQIITTAEANDWSDLDWSNTGIVVPDAEAGWLSPNGKLHGCDCGAHHMVAAMILKSTSKSLELRGWFHVAGPRAVLWIDHNTPTQRQQEWAASNGHKFKRDGEFWPPAPVRNQVDSLEA